MCDHDWKYLLFTNRTCKKCGFIDVLCPRSGMYASSYSCKTCGFEFSLCKCKSFLDKN